MDRNVARQLADEYRRNRQTQTDSEYFIVEGTDDVILVVVTRTARGLTEKAVKAITESVRSVTPSASGRPCPNCGGTGKI